MRFRNKDWTRELTSESTDNVDSRTFSHVVNIGFERKTQTGNRDLRLGTTCPFSSQLKHNVLHSFDHPSWFSIVDFPCATDNPRIFGRPTDNEPRIYRYTMPTNTGTRLQNFYSWMPISKVY